MARPLNILSIASLFPDASRPNFGIFVEMSLAALARQPDVALTVVAPVGIPPWPLSLHARYAALRHLPRREIWRGLTVERPRFLLFPGVAARNAAAMARAVLPLARAMQAAGHIDVIDAQFFWPDGPAASEVATALDLPFSVKARGADISHWAVRADTGPLIRDAADKASGLLAVADSMKADMVATGMAADKIRTHYTGVDRARFHPGDRATARAAMALPDNAVLLLTVGALIERKGQSLVIDALSALPRNVHYAMAGSGPDKAALRAKAQAAGLADRVHFLGNVANDALPALYNAADLMVLPSASEGLANAWVEASACGTPVLLSDIAPAHEFVALTGGGAIAAREPLAIATAVTNMLDHPVDRATLSAATHARFDWDRNGAELADHLRAVAGHTGKSG